MDTPRRRRSRSSRVPFQKPAWQPRPARSPTPTSRLNFPKSEGLASLRKTVLRKSADKRLQEIEEEGRRLVRRYEDGFLVYSREVMEEL